MSKRNLTRRKIIHTLLKALKPLSFVHAFYEGGAAAFNRIDKWSDIDLYLVVDDDKVDATFAAVEGALKSLSTIKRKYSVSPLPWPGVSQAFYRLEKASEYLLVDLAVLKLSSPEKFVQPEIHGKVEVYFNKSGKMQIPLLDRDTIQMNLQAHLERVQARFDMFNNVVRKELNRRNWLEALDLYRAITLSLLVEVLRVKHNPSHHDFRMRYVYYELPPDVVEKLEHLSFVRDPAELKKKYREASKWLQESLSSLQNQP